MKMSNTSEWIEKALKIYYDCFVTIIPQNFFILRRGTILLQSLGQSQNKSK
jgi:hypothetical protein